MATFGLDAAVFRNKRAGRRDGPEQVIPKSRIHYVVVDESEESEEEISSRSRD